MTEPSKRRGLIATIMHASDDVVAVIQYRDEWGRLTERVVSPIRFLGPGRFLAFCLGREANRTFYLGRCIDIKVAPSASVMAGRESLSEEPDILKRVGRLRP